MAIRTTSQNNDPTQNSHKTGTTTNSEYKNKITTLVQTDRQTDRQAGRQTDRQTVKATGA